jgi:hypothetical protein
LPKKSDSDSAHLILVGAWEKKLLWSQSVDPHTSLSSKLHKNFKELVSNTACISLSSQKTAPIKIVEEIRRIVQVHERERFRNYLL